MKTVRNILIAFILNISFSIFEFVGGIITGSVAIFSDAIHDLGDALSIGVSYFLEKKSKSKPDKTYSYGYARYSVIGSLFTTIVLIIGSVLVIYGSIKRLLNPTHIDYSKMIVFAIFGVIVNFLAAYFTHEGDSVNQKAVNLHMLEDVLGWLIILVGAILMNFVDAPILDPIMSLGISAFILYEAVKNLFNTLKLFLEKTPDGVDLNEIKHHLLELKGVLDIHHMHIWTLDGSINYATLHAVIKEFDPSIKNQIKEELKEHQIHHVTVELELESEHCDEKECHVEAIATQGHSHHNHH